MPRRPRATRSQVKVLATAQPYEASANTAMPTTSSKRRPNRSPAAPPSSCGALGKQVGVDHPLQVDACYGSCGLS